ncbi:MAG: P-loop NTPase [Candidatus Thermoplasmatota archaeon]|nr:P-loop NTPase [Candidatus Thermoplasmatota archaeon]
MEIRASVIEKRLKNVKEIIAVASGKGGVGKSLTASSIALYLSQKGHKVGLLDLDLHGPSQHIILGLKEEYPHEEKGIIPPKIHGINFMSIVYFTRDKPSPFRGVDITNIILELFAITQWGELDFLIIDMPPGTGEETLDIIRFIPKIKFLIVSTPSSVAYGAVSKLLDILKEMKLPMLGIIENMQMNNNKFTKEKLANTRFKYLGGIYFDKNLENSIGNPKKLIRTKFMQDLSQILQSVIYS